jgi:hypothetical protein
VPTTANWKLGPGDAQIVALVMEFQKGYLHADNNQVKLKDKDGIIAPRLRLHRIVDKHLVLLKGVWELVDPEYRWSWVFPFLAASFWLY